MHYQTTAQTRADLDAELLRILQDASPGRGARPHGITVYQALHRMSSNLFATLAQNAVGGLGSGGPGGMAASQFVQRGMSRLVKKGLVDFLQVDAQGIAFDVKADSVRAGYPVTTFYFLK